MAHLFVEAQSTPFNGGQSAEDVWAVVPLGDHGTFMLGAGADYPVRPCNADECGGAALLLRGRGPEGDAWLVLSAAPNRVRINGGSLHMGIRALRNGDELHVDGLGRLFFSTEQLARIEPFPGAARPVFCPRCKQEIGQHYQAVRCPQCSVWHHQSEDLPCWTYSETCALCDQPTQLGAGYRWTPEGL